VQFGNELFVKEEISSLSWMETVPLSVWNCDIPVSADEYAKFLQMSESQRDQFKIRKFLEWNGLPRKDEPDSVYQKILSRQRASHPDCRRVTLKHLQQLASLVNRSGQDPSSHDRIHLALRSIDMVLWFLHHYWRIAETVLTRCSFGAKGWLLKENNVVDLFFEDDLLDEGEFWWHEGYGDGLE
jgi:hypothetical protein